jgi:phospholipid/cholesterol/gamma-HCH transport system ATP-binding protein
VVVTHELTSAFLIADRIVVLDKGAVLAKGTPDEIRHSTLPRIRQFLERQADHEEQDAEKYLNSLTEEA